MLLVVFAIIGFSGNRNLLSTHAQSVVVSPTFNCLGPCPKDSASISPSASTSPSATISQNPTVSTSAPSISSTQPCSNQTPLQASQQQKKGSSSNHHHEGGFLQEIFQLLQLFLQVILSVGGTGTPSSSPCPQSTAPVASPQPQTSVTPSTASASAGTTGRTYPWHTNIVSTTFWVGEIFDPKLADGSQVCSTYDSSWAFHWSGVNNGTVPSNASGCPGAIVGGCDGVSGADNACATEARTAANGYFPSQGTPKENPFYLDLPFDDVNDTTAFGQRCDVIPWANDPNYAGHCTDTNFSYMKNKFVRIVGPNGNTCYGQIEDAGPSEGSNYHDAAYVFGENDAQPGQGQFNNAGADVSPALNGCLGFAELDGQNDKIKWQFVDDGDVPEGPWKKIITTSEVTH